MIVFKFGGTSIGDHAGFRRVGQLIEGRCHGSLAEEMPWVVVSAMGGATDALLAMSRQAEAADKSYGGALHAFMERHRECLSVLCGADQEGLRALERYEAALQELLHGVYLLREASIRSLDLIASFGERMAARILTRFLIHEGCEATYLDGRRLFRTTTEWGRRRIDKRRTYDNLKRYRRRHKGLQILAGYIASDKDRVTTTLGRGGSDHTATLVAAALEATEVVIWTDVDGIMTAPPSAVPVARPIASLSYASALEMAHFGAKVIHAPALQPVAEAGIAMRICNTFRSSAPGTYISASPTDWPYAISGLSALYDVECLQIEGHASLFSEELVARILTTLAEAQLPILVFASSGPRQVMRLMMRSHDAVVGQELLLSRYGVEMARKQIQNITRSSGYALLTLVGQDMFQRAGIAARLFEALAARRISIHMIGQGASGLSLSLALEAESLNEALLVLHDAFFSEPS